MKIKLFKKSNLLLLILPILFFTLHFFIYVSDPVSPDGFFLVSHDPEPFNIEAIKLQKARYPSYSNPFQEFEYHYTEKYGNETVIIEQGSMFKVDMDVIFGAPKDYYNPEVDGIHYKGFAVDDYPNTLFYLVQYLIAIAFAYAAGKKILELRQ